MPVELGVNPLRLHCLLKALDAGRIRLVKLGVNPSKAFNRQAYNVQAGIQCNLNGFPPNLTDSTRHHLNEK